MSKIVKRHESLEKILEVLPPKYQKQINDAYENPAKILKLLILLGIICLFHSIFSYYTIFAFSLLSISLSLLLYVKIKKLREKGLINLFSPKTQLILFQRSIFDILCDLWFMPRIGLYIKAFLGPFYYSVSPEQALSNFEIIGLSRAVTVKGIANLFPGLRKIMLPINKIEKNNNICDDEKKTDSEESKEENDDEYSDKKFEFKSKFTDKNFATIEIKSSIIYRTENFKDENIPLVLREQKDNKKNKLSQKTRNSLIDKDKNAPKFKHFYDEMTIQEFTNYEKNIFMNENDNIDEIPLEKKKTNLNPIKNQISLPLENNEIIEIPKTKIITSSKQIKEFELLEKKKRESIPISTKWDNLEKFEKKKNEEKKKIEKGIFDEQHEMKGLFKVMNIVNDIKKNGILSKLDNIRLYKLFGISSLLLVGQLYFNGNTRRWMQKTLLIILYLIPLGISGTTMGLIAMKILKNQKNKNNKKQIE